MSRPIAASATYAIGPNRATAVGFGFSSLSATSPPPGRARTRCEQHRARPLSDNRTELAGTASPLVTGPARNGTIVRLKASAVGCATSCRNETFWPASPRMGGACRESAVKPRLDEPPRSARTAARRADANCTISAEDEHL